MTSDIIEYCLTKNGAYIDHPFGPDSLVIKVKGRIFAQLFTLNGEKMATFNCDAAQGQYYRMLYPGIVTRGYHCPPVQQPYFNTIRLTGEVALGEIKDMVDHAYARVINKLPRAAFYELEKQE